MQLRIPGPTPVPPEILAAGAQQMINHRGPEFITLMRDITAGLKRWFQTENDVFVLTASGTGGLETAIVNTFSPGDRVLAVSIGAFGDRFAEIARAFGAEVTKLDFPAGSPADPDVIRRKLQSAGPFKAVLVTHNETSTGVTNDISGIGKAVRAAAPDALFLVDAISGLSSIDLKTDAWGCDVVISGSQKGWMIPPGLTFVSYGRRAWAAHETAKMPRFYFDLTAAKKQLEQGQTPATPAVSLFFSMDAALKMLDAEGMANVFERHARVAARAREGVKALGLELLVADERYASNTVTAVKKPDGLDLGKFLKILRDDHQVILSGGQASLTGKIFRIGHLGFVDVADMDEVLTAIKLTLPRAI